jgi:uncharacterized membrane protein
MAISTVRATSFLAAPAERIFAVVSDYGRAGEVIEDVQQITPVVPTDTGLGAQFDARVKLGPKTISIVFRLAELVPNTLVTWASASGDGRRLSFHLRSEDSGTAVELVVDYETPDGLRGIVLAPVVREMVQTRAASTLRNLATLSLAT